LYLKLSLDLEKMVEKAIIVCFVTKEKVIHLDDKLGVSMIFSDPTQSLVTNGNQVNEVLLFIRNQNTNIFP
jgi:hypothetical protein